MSKSPTKQLADSNSPTKLADNFIRLNQFENKIFYFCRGKFITSYILMNINDLGAMAVSSVFNLRLCYIAFLAIPSMPPLDIVICRRVDVYEQFCRRLTRNSMGVN